MLRPGEHVGAYQVVCAVGRGGMATVYRVVDLRDASNWALKVLTLQDPGLAERFVGEAEMQAVLDHPQVVRAREMVSVGNSLGIVMEYVAGATLDQWLHDHPDASEGVKLDIVLQVIDGVRAAHRAGLVHRDLKPGNVLIAEGPDGRFEAKITDFGLAKLRGATALTQTGVAMGTPRYMAPEQLMDAKNVDGRADVYALGALIYEVFTGRPAFRHANFAEAFEAVETGSYEDPRNFGVSRRITRVIRAALEPDADRRVATCGDLADLLQGRIRRSRRRLTWRAAAVGLLVGGAGAAWWAAPETWAALWASMPLRP